MNPDPFLTCCRDAGGSITTDLPRWLATNPVGAWRVTALVACLLLALLPVPRATGAGAEDTATQRQVPADHRQIAVWVWNPTELPQRGTILFSHGYASAPWKYELLIRHWVAAGYQVRAPLHMDSTDHPRHTELSGASIWAARLLDMRALSAELGTETYIAAGHSYGALTALVLGGAESVIPEGLSAPLADPQVTVVLAFSPPPAIPDMIPASGYAKLARPALIQSGTRDVAMGSDEKWEQRMDAFHAAAAGGHRYGLVLEGVDHYFGGAICRPELPGPAQLEELSIAAEVSVKMLQAYSEGDPAAREYLQQSLSSSGRTILLYK